LFERALQSFCESCFWLGWCSLLRTSPKPRSHPEKEEAKREKENYSPKFGKSKLSLQLTTIKQIQQEKKKTSPMTSRLRSSSSLIRSSSSIFLVLNVRRKLCRTSKAISADIVRRLSRLEVLSTSKSRCKMVLDSKQYKCLCIMQRHS